MNLKHQTDLRFAQLKTSFGARAKVESQAVRETPENLRTDAKWPAAGWATFGVLERVCDVAQKSLRRKYCLVADL
jgi:hypothetical protein